MRFLVATMLAGLVLLAGCQTKGERKAPCPPISGYAEAEDLCGLALPVNDVFAPVLKE
jgi:nitrous oxide reductase accessory protein NosL